MIRITVALIASLILGGCATKVIPIQANLSSVEVEVKHPKSDKSYFLLSTSKEGVIDVRRPDANGRITYSLSRAAQEPNKCFYVSDGEKVVPINDSRYGFSNAVLNQYIAANDLLTRTNQELIPVQNSIAETYSYRNGGCVTLTARDIPPQPETACAQRVQRPFAEQACRSQYVKPPTIGEAIRNSIVSAIGGAAVTIVAGPFVGVGAGVAIDLFLSGNDKQRKYGECLQAAESSCKQDYDSWYKVAIKIRDNSDGLYQQCKAGMQKFDILDRQQVDLNVQIAALKASPGIVLESHYCASQK